MAKKGARAGPGRARRGRKRKKYAGRNNGPARQRYWASGRLRERKIRALMRSCGMTRALAILAWSRSKRMK